MKKQTETEFINETAIYARQELADIQDQMLNLINSADALMRKLQAIPEFERIADSAKAYWLAHMKINTTNDHGYLGGAGISMQDTLDSISDIADEFPGNE